VYTNQFSNTALVAEVVRR